MAKSRMLIYGGCHALVLRDLFLAVWPDALDIDLLINFALIARAEPFPYDALTTYDLVVYSPVENREGYNTNAPRAHCERAGVRAICFPWLEWHGYCPGAVKGIFKGRFQWYYPRLLDMAREHSSFDAFFEHAVRAYPDDDTIETTLVQSSARVTEAEERNGADVRVADFIAARFRDSRLLLISDHPSITLYRHVFDQIVALVDPGTRRDSYSWKLCFSTEPQWRWRTPILPRAARALDLAFDDTTWIDDELLPGRSFDLRTYLSLYYYEDSLILGPLDRASLLLRNPRSTGRRETVEATTRLMMEPIGVSEPGGFEDYRLLETLCGDAETFVPNSRLAIRPEEWRSTWAF